MTTLRTQWNTGRGYSKLGQRIVAEHQDGKVRFIDHDRGIWGEFDHKIILSASSLQAAVMDAYDHNRYRWTHIATGELQWIDPA